ncbi:hypothetical protein DM01DRAFT_1375858 [Hesseltinella vesiculosa]|uniref:Uncharacterized protein n=1 Tax=Hesseltinella vesiculosa TaxID=101127 RepID=A0A1X2GCE9_9FUNG|nr:hypothetical protein DM01DRAFT_1375858 [Hesseltinella vesiculosa]
MAKLRKTSNKGKDKPYQQANEQKKRRITKSERVKNADLTAQLDQLTKDLPLTKTKKPRQDKASLQMEKAARDQQLALEQQRYEQTKNDLDNALDLLTKL